MQCLCSESSEREKKIKEKITIKKKKADENTIIVSVSQQDHDLF